ncbi:SEC14-like protein 2 [Caerostris extrusa]|uniref:SEC14-like protein 2 n=1 Tax=Caerostris extrusa TaxID=172846 RepID=A0AAV4W200_CAEEX|nr:SEC14-like protein 2 [Caerostris extrusa]
MTYEANYPERLKTAYIINASVYFSLIFSIIKPLLSGNTIKKISIHGKEGWKENLVEVIDADVLPGFLGGNRTDPDGNANCVQSVKHGQNIPKEYYMTKSVNRLKDQPTAKRLIVSRKSKTPIELEVDESGSTIEYEFETDSKDIGFGLFYKETANNKCECVELIPKQRIDTHLSSETGLFLCDKAGIYMLMFDNTYSWIHQKEIYYKVQVSPPVINLN